MVYFETATLKFDGSCDPNPGNAGSGYFLQEFEHPGYQCILKGKYYVGSDATNNVAEYFALIKGLKRIAKSDHKIGHLAIKGDSELVINQLNGTYQVKPKRLRSLHQITTRLLKERMGKDFDSYSISWVNRKDNWQADGLANDAQREETSWSYDYHE